MTTRTNDEGGFLGWADLKGEPGRATPGASSPTWDATNDAWAFADNQDQELKWTMQFDHDYRQGSDVKPHVHWKPVGTSTGNAKWQLSYKWENPTDSDAGSWTTITQVVEVPTGESQIVINLPAAVPAGKKAQVKLEVRARLVDEA